MIVVSSLSLPILKNWIPSDKWRSVPKLIRSQAWASSLMPTIFWVSLLTNILGRVYFQDSPHYFNNTVNPGKHRQRKRRHFSCSAMWSTPQPGSVRSSRWLRRPQSCLWLVPCHRDIHWPNPVNDFRHHSSCNGRHSMLLALLAGCRSWWRLSSVSYSYVRVLFDCLSWSVHRIRVCNAGIWLFICSSASS